MLAGAAKHEAALLTFVSAAVYELMSLEAYALNSMSKLMSLLLQRQLGEHAHFDQARVWPRPDLPMKQFR